MTPTTQGGRFPRQDQGSQLVTSRLRGPPRSGQGFPKNSRPQLPPPHTQDWAQNHSPSVTDESSVTILRRGPSRAWLLLGAADTAQDRLGKSNPNFCLILISTLLAFVNKMERTKKVFPVAFTVPGYKTFPVNTETQRLEVPIREHLCRLNSTPSQSEERKRRRKAGGARVEGQE